MEHCKVFDQYNKGADLNIIGGDGGTPINWAVHHDNVEIIKMMVKKGAKLNIRNKWGMTELHTAIWRGCIHLGDYLMLEIWRQGDRLKIIEFGPDEIYPVAKDFFYFKQAPWKLIFSRDNQGKIKNAHYHSSGDLIQ